jgi:alpha-L-glutamate ligase-like protein
MIFNEYRKLGNGGVLGMNFRNAVYIMGHNARSAFPLVDNKVETKRLAGKLGIPIPELYYVVESHGNIEEIPNVLKQLPDEFVLKPARGSGGSGIILIKERTEAGFVTQSGKVLSEEDFTYHISSILSGVFSLGGAEDVAIIEALIHPDPVFSSVTYHGGVPDIRVIVYRGIPVMAMVRLPTKASDGKANLHKGAIGAGIELGSGVTLDAVHLSHIVSHHPDTENQVSGIHIPHWDELLLTASKTTEMTGLGYIGADFVLDKDKGPILLELNARPGLGIQMANQTGLRIRLDKTDSAAPAVFFSPESRVAWARATFGQPSG